ncbi:hypothetical protein HK12_03465 [Acetobacter orientalis]|uniref:Uncharacterized protein n=2 Tax=Acetobacter orientalis TaxID=146474 RepID=A0A252A732_9PROT|nr:hypothetical protein HK12_03465 [Acetobacter orientalis]
MVQWSHPTPAMHAPKGSILCDTALCPAPYAMGLPNTALLSIFTQRVNVQPHQHTPELRKLLDIFAKGVEHW